MKKDLKPFDKTIDAKITLPGSKSISNRVYIYSALCSEKVEILGALESEDTQIMKNALSNFHGEIFCGNSGTSLRFLTSFAALQNEEIVLCGKERMHKRPIEPLLSALRELGVDAKSVNSDGCPPVLVNGNGKILGGKCKMRGDLSSQFFSSLMAVAPLAENPVEIEIEEHLVSIPYVQMTVDLLKEFGISVDFDGKKIRIEPQKYKSPKVFQIEGDSSAASHLLSLCLAVGGKMTVSPMKKDSVQGDTNFAYVLEKMGASLEWGENSLTIKSDGKVLPLGEINLEDMPDASMNAVVLAVLADGESTIRGLSTLRHKETDRISALCTELKKMGASVEEGEDYIKISGGKPLHDAEIKTYDDHRMAMCFAILGAVVPDVRILGAECVEKTFPEFWKAYEQVGRF